MDTQVYSLTQASNQPTPAPIRTGYGVHTDMDFLRLQLLHYSTFKAHICTEARHESALCRYVRCPRIGPVREVSAGRVPKPIHHGYGNWTGSIRPCQFAVSRPPRSIDETLLRTGKKKGIPFCWVCVARRFSLSLSPSLTRSLMLFFLDPH